MDVIEIGSGEWGILSHVPSGTYVVKRGFRTNAEAWGWVDKNGQEGLRRYRPAQSNSRCFQRMLLARMSGNPDLIIEQDPETIQFGPKMAALSEKRRALVVALFDDDAPSKGDGLLPWAARKAGYGTATSSTRSLGNIAGRIIHDDAVQDGIKEHSHRVMRAIPPEAIRALKAIIRESLTIANT